MKLTNLPCKMDCGLHVESTVGQGSVFTLIILPVRDLPGWQNR